MSPNKKRQFEKTRELFEDAGCPTIETEWLPARAKWRYLCECGEIKEIRPHDFKKGKRCRDCGRTKLSEVRRTPVEEVKESFEKNGEELLEVFLKGNRTFVRYLCVNGHLNEKAYYSYKEGYGCAECASKKASVRYRMDIHEVRDIFKEYGCHLLEENYVNQDKKLKYRCSCGNISYGYISAIRKGIKCGCQRKKGPEHHMWNESLTEEDRLKSRNYDDYREWVNAVYKRDDYTCQKCWMRGGTLNAHHIKGYADFPGLRTELNNGLTLCGNCHRNFHNQFGYKGFGEGDLILFLLQHADELTW